MVEAAIAVPRGISITSTSGRVMFLNLVVILLFKYDPLSLAIQQST
jgi:hypothetical protein